MENRRLVQASRKVSDRDLIARCTHGLAYEQTGDGRAARWAHTLFDPLFLALHRMALLLIRC
jgi:hypothetical protein